MKKQLLVLSMMAFSFCNSGTHKKDSPAPVTQTEKERVRVVPFEGTNPVIHVFVALCDNQYQGIIPVPPKIGNGQDKDNNLYWGCSAGMRTYFKNSAGWTLIRKLSIDSIRMERLIFKSRQSNYYLIADAYNGKYIRNCTIDFLRSCSGQQKDTLTCNGVQLGINGNAKLLAYIGHDGLMDFRLTDQFVQADQIKRDAVVLACISKKYFAPHLAATGAYPLVWTTGLMCPEAYTLHDALEGYIKKETPESIRMRAVKAYAAFQHCGIKAASNLLVTGY